MAQSTPDNIRLRVTKPWRATYSPALAVAAGQKVRVGRRDDDHPGWQWVERDDGLGGWVPADIVADGRITEEFDTTELSVSVGDRPVLLCRRLGWSLLRAPDGRQGWVPDDCLAREGGPLRG